LADPTALPSLLKTLEDQDARVRRAVVSALGATGDPEALPALSKMLWDNSALVRAGAAEALGKLADPRAAAPLCQKLTDPDPGVRWYCVRALGAVGGLAAVPLLEPLLHDNNEIFGVSVAAAVESAVRQIQRRERNHKTAR
jgi:HEAT repeat protein